MNQGEAKQWLKEQIQGVYEAEEAGNIAALVLEELGGLSREESRSKKKELLSASLLNQITEVSNRLLLHEPVQYILEHAWFAGLKLYVNPSVLIPRPETEELVHWIIQDMKTAGLPVFRQPAGVADKTNLLKILDVGTGSGCIALALKAAMPGAEVWGCDLSEEALNIARRNGSETDIRVDFQGVDFIDRAQHSLLPAVDVIVCNPPYIPIRDKYTIAANVIRFEPHKALFVPNEDPLVFYRRLAKFGQEKLHPGGHIYVEIEENSGAAVLKLFEKEKYKTVILKKDMQGKDRMVKASELIR
ncbi:MAG: peptide chain release factor N(5)-glutamine methyltransferase [Chitinophagaceae bacterium]